MRGSRQRWWVDKFENRALPDGSFCHLGEVEYSPEVTTYTELQELRQKREPVTYANESELCDWFERWAKDTGWEVYKEVSTFYGYCDLVLVRELNGEEIHWGVEAKMSCNSDVIAQAERNTEVFHYSSVLSPFEPNYIYEEHMRRHGVGCIKIAREKKSYMANHYEFYRPAGFGANTEPIFGLFVPTNPGVRVCIPAVPHEERRRKSSYELHELHKHQSAGECVAERITPYKLSVVRIQDLLRGSDKGWWTVREIADAIGGELHWCNVPGGIRNACGQWETDKFDTKVEKGKLHIRLKDEKDKGT